MIEVIVLSVVLARPPIRGNTSEESLPFCSDSTVSQMTAITPHFKIIPQTGSANLKSPSIKDYSTASELTRSSAEIDSRFHQLADAWSSDTSHISSTRDIVANQNYQEIIAQGWDVVPLLLKDLRENKRFWFPALAAITNVRPFDPSDAGNGKRMTDAWIKWAKRKGLI